MTKEPLSQGGVGKGVKAVVQGAQAVATEIALTGSNGPVAQPGERNTGSVEVRGSIPLRSTKNSKSTINFALIYAKIDYFDSFTTDYKLLKYKA